MVILEVIICCILCLFAVGSLVILIGSNALSNNTHPVKLWLLNILYLIFIGSIYAGAIVLIILF